MSDEAVNKNIANDSSDNYQKDRLKIIFEYSPIAIWEEDFSALATLRQKMKKLNVSNIREFLANNHDVVAETFRNLRVLDVNQAALKLYGATSKKELISKLGKTIHKDAMSVLIDEFATLIDGAGEYHAEFKSRRLDGAFYDVAMKVSVPEVYKDSFKRVIVTFQDISVQKKFERHLKRLASTDGLTKMLNHTSIRYRLEEEYRRAMRYHLDLSIMMIDMNDFKMVNDVHGHQKGDQVIQRTAKLIKSHLRDVDIVGRYGGDEFLIILPETPPENAHIAADRITKLFDSLVDFRPKRSIYCRVSAGVCGRPGDDVKSAQQMIELADERMYKNKKSKR